MYGQPPPYGAPPGYGAPPAYGAPPGYGAPGYGAPPPPNYYPPQQSQGPMIINLGNNNNSSGTHCPICGSETGNLPRKKVGCVAIAWCLCLLFTVGGYGLCFIPFCTDGCKDTELVCVKCSTVKQTINANCC